VAARRDPVQAAPAVREAITRLAQVLYDIDSSPELALVRDRAQLRGRSATVAAEAAALVDGLWTRYPLLSDAGERIEAALTTGNRQELASLLHAQGITLPEGTRTGAVALLQVLETDAERASTAIKQLGTAWRNAVPRLDALRVRLVNATTSAEALGMPGAPELAAARTVVDDVTAQAAADPLGADLDEAEQLVQRVEERLAELARTRASIGADLDAAEARLEDLARLIAAGRGARKAAEDRILAPGGLATPLDPAELDTGDRALRPWLKRIRAQAAAGAWPAAAKGLEQWQEEADALHARAGAVAAANRAPLERRNDLRGLLDAFRAKAAALGLAEDPALTERYRSAREALYAYRCDVRRAETLVREYGRAIELPPSGGGPVR
jgi:chromosome segregation ATPase